MVKTVKPPAPETCSADVSLPGQVPRALLRPRSALCPRAPGTPVLPHPHAARLAFAGPGGIAGV